MAKKITAPLVDNNTGEFIDTSRVYELELGERIFTNKQREFLRQRDARYQDPTPFVWLDFQYNTNLDFPVDKAVAVRFLYFGTACGYQGKTHEFRIHRPDRRQIVPAAEIHRGCQFLIA